MTLTRLFAYTPTKHVSAFALRKKIANFTKRERELIQL